MTGEVIIEYRDVHKAFGDNVVFAGMNLEVFRGETITIMGGSGIGKSVALKLLIGLLKPEQGQIFVDGQDVVPLGERELLQVRRKVGMLFQGAALFDSITVGENVAYPLREQFNLSEDEIQERVSKYLGMVGLEGVEDLMPSELSGGMKKRVGLARAIATEPKIILYDEPTTGLDPYNTRRINELIIKMQRELNVTSIVVTHDVASALMVSDRIALIHRKKIATVRTVEEIRRNEDSLLDAFMKGRLEE
ncbi:MAG TPA: ABC transporter ATP-binding protein [Proteobacteria bacterium]|nr:ABC transporter ATP-binding protein [Pseudomonadota bacterium]